MKLHRKNIVASSTLVKDQIRRRETYEYHGSKKIYTGSDHSFTERSHDK